MKFLEWGIFISREDDDYEVINLSDELCKKILKELDTKKANNKNIIKLKNTKPKHARNLW